MEFVDNEYKPEAKDMCSLFAEKMIKQSKFRDAEKHIYRVEQMYKHHVLMRNEFGFRHSFTYPEALWGLT